MAHGMAQGAAVPDWLGHLPGRLLAVDVETTGLGAEDRVVSFGAVLLDTATLLGGSPVLACHHLIFDPGRPSHPRAEAVHGYDDWLLRHQDPARGHLDAVAALLAGADLVVAHNAAFDLGFLAREFRAAGRPDPARPTYCTMEAYRRRGEPGSSALDAVCRRVKLARAGARHGALEDAWLALRVYLWLQGCPVRVERPALAAPSNLRPAPKRPDGTLPPRTPA
ncbi:Exonuclease RNase T and DNA polymerase III [Methylobacterium sp. 4-46]|uniref:3'-5' exonuclease n=1 Tax=unclassified Methylobacterium TaxID=2615210 RepID=UPI000165C6DD|nr:MULTISPECIES: 3'-5' exonuclease [Methylobacterium]ACA15916.1 Exonuclease RNase T and DNA polymerase III [Methylobacterium sp. 4-46]WFT81633.1 3'-5' exonuclease [Methylobacterium nodulans]